MRSPRRGEMEHHPSDDDQDCGNCLLSARQNRTLFPEFPPHERKPLLAEIKP